MKFVYKILFYFGITALFAFLVLQLFFPSKLNELEDTYLHGAADEKELISNKKLSIGYAFPADSFDPVKFDPNTRSRILNIYEPLVRTDRNLQIRPALAVSWGRTDDKTWEFRLRPNVLFHDGSALDTDDVIESFARALKPNLSQLADILDTIDKIEKKDDLTLVITTKRPDPLLINRLSTVLIFPSEKKTFSTPEGTGPYQYSTGDTSDLTLKRFDNYWGDLPFYNEVLITTIQNRFSRLDAIKEGDIQILANVPPNFAEELEDHEAVSITSFPSLEVNYIMFDMDDEFLKDIEIREAICMAFDKDAMVDLSQGYARASSQFVSTGVFGFNPEINSSTYDLDTAKEIIRAHDPFKRPTVTVDLAEGAEMVGEYIKDQLNEAGITAIINIIPFTELERKINNKETQIYYLAWKSELGDASAFLENNVYSKGQFNGGGYNSKKVDQLIALSLRNLDQEERVMQLQEIMKIIVEEDMIGVPLFESDSIYGIRAGIQFKPRLDGFILAAEIK